MQISAQISLQEKKYLKTLKKMNIYLFILIKQQNKMILQILASFILFFSFFLSFFFFFFKIISYNYYFESVVTISTNMFVFLNGYNKKKYRMNKKTKSWKICPLHQIPNSFFMQGYPENLKNLSTKAVQFDSVHLFINK